RRKVARPRRGRNGADVLPREEVVAQPDKWSDEGKFRAFTDIALLHFGCDSQPSGSIDPATAATALDHRHRLVSTSPGRNPFPQCDLGSFCGLLVPNPKGRPVIGIG